jgi:hypothetical protein
MENYTTGICYNYNTAQTSVVSRDLPLPQLYKNGNIASFHVISRHFTSFHVIMSVCVHFVIGQIICHSRHVIKYNLMALSVLKCHLMSFSVIQCHNISCVIGLFRPAFKKVGRGGQICLSRPSATASLSGQMQKY